MEFSLLDNGHDSLKKAKFSIEKYEELIKEHSYPYFKDAIIFLNHGIEILFKYMLSQRNESLIFSDVQIYLAAKKELKKMPKGKTGFGFLVDKDLTVFDVPPKKINDKKLKTITIIEALDRIEYFCDIEIKKEFRSAVFTVNRYRNDLTHHSINLTSEEETKAVKTIKVLFDIVLDFFEEHIPGTMVTIDAEKFEITSQEWEEMQREMEDFYQERGMSDLGYDDV